HAAKSRSGLPPSRDRSATFPAWTHRDPNSTTDRFRRAGGPTLRLPPSPSARAPLDRRQRWPAAARSAVGGMGLLPRYLRFHGIPSALAVDRGARIILRRRPQSLRTQDRRNSRSPTRAAPRRRIGLTTGDCEQLRASRLEIFRLWTLGIGFGRWSN